MKRRKFALSVLTGLIVGLGIYVFTLPAQAPNFDDFGVYYRAGAKAFAHLSVYDVMGHLQFKYSPFVALFFGCTFSLFPYETACPAFYTLSAMLWFAFAVMLANDAAHYYRRRLPREISTATATWVGLLLFFFFFIVGVRDELKLGQINLAALGFGYLAFRHHEGKGNHTVQSGVFLALAIQFKLYCAIFLPILLFRRAWATLFFTVATIAVMNYGWIGAFDSLDFAVSEMNSWFASLFASSRELMTNGYNVSLLGVLFRAIGPEPWVYGVWFALFSFFMTFAFAMRNADPFYGFLFGMATVLPLNPLSWPYWTILSAPALVYVGLPSALGVRKNGVVRKLWLLIVGGAFFGFSLQQNQPLSQRWGILVATLLLLIEYVNWFRREVIAFRASPKWAVQTAEDQWNSGSE